MQRTKKLEEKKIKTREQNKGRKIKTLLSSPIHLAHHCSTVKPLSLRCRTDIATLSLYCHSAVATLSHRYCSAVAPQLSLCCRTAVAPLSHRYRSTVAPILSLLLLLRSLTSITPKLRHCCSAAVAPAVDTQSHRYRTSIAPLSLRCRAVVELLSLRPREGIKNSKLNCCCSTVTPLSLLLSIGRFTRLSPQEA